MFGVNLNMHNVENHEHQFIEVDDYLSENPNAQNEDGNTVLHKYIINRQRDPEIFQIIINNGARLEMRNSTGKTPFLLAVIHRNKTIVEKFLLNRADVYAVDDAGHNALHYLALPELNDHFEHVGGGHFLPADEGKFDFEDTFSILERLLKEGIDINLMNNRSETPLMLAARGYHLKIVKMLLKYGANVHLKNENAETCLHLASTRTPINIKVWDERNANIMSELIGNGACVNCIDNTGRTPLGCILKSRHRNKDYFARAFLTAASLANLWRRIEFFVLENRILGDRPAEVSLINHVDDCYREIGRMRNFQLFESHDEQRIEYEVKSKVLDILLRETFPLYHDYILFGFDVTFLRLRFMELHFSSISEGRNISLGPVETFVIASYLEIKDLYNAFVAFWSKRIL